MCIDDYGTKAVTTAPELVLVRGLPGSGKSTFARTMKSHIHIEQDMFFMQPDGSYLYDDLKMQKAINWCQNRTRNALLQGHNVVVANTFCRGLEWECYVGMAINIGASLRFVEAVGCYQTLHNVPVERIERMRARWETLPSVFEKATTLS